MPVKATDAVVVITGASSGIGKAAALEFAGQGAKMVVTSRRDEALEATASECRIRGAEALAVPADVSNEDDVREVARRALDRFGRIDVWINNAGIGAAGRFTEMPAEAFRKVIETNFFGYVYGARAALPVFRRQRRGVLINNASMVARFPEPYFTAYVASKHAILGFSGSLRQELFLEGFSDVHVCTLMPAAIDTPFFQHSANYTGRAIKVPPPVYPAQKVAEAMVECAGNPRREFFVGGSALIFNLQKRLSTTLAEPALAKVVDKTHFYGDKTALPTDGSIFSPMPDGTSISGGWNNPGGFNLHEEGISGKRKSLLGRSAYAAAGLTLALGFLAYFRGMRLPLT
ncbi:MAG: short-chain dehydrogenase/reductase [Fibrobacteres bacterium]|nr:short-chain dehydrogenase/reductase [Fibrobacterota bacterium]